MTESSFAQQKLDRRQIINAIAAIKDGRITNRELIERVKRLGISFQLTPENEKLLREEGASNELIEAIRQSANSTITNSITKSFSKTYSEMSDTEKRVYISYRTNEFLGKFGKKNDVPSFAVDRIKQFLDYYQTRVAARPRTGSCGFGDNLEKTLQLGSQYSGGIGSAFIEKGLPPEIGIYVAMIESEFCPCLQSPTGTLGMFQFPYATSMQYFEPNSQLIRGATPTTPDDRCKPEKAAKATAKYLKFTSDNYFGKDGDGLLLTVAAFNSGEGGLKRNIQTVKDLNIVKGKVTFWDLLTNSDKLSKQFQAENIKYVPKFLAAMIVGENPRDFGILSFSSPLSLSEKITGPLTAYKPQPENLNVSLEFWKKQQEKALEERDTPTGEDAEVVEYEELVGVVKQLEALKSIRTKGFKMPLDFFDLAKGRMKNEFVELPIATEIYVVDVGGNATNSEFTTFSFENGSKPALTSSAEYQTLKKLADNLNGQKYDLNNPNDRKQIRMRLLRMLQPKAKIIVEEIATKYYEEFDRPLRVTSLIRPLDYQINLNSTNANSFKVSVDAFPPHSSGLAFDLSYGNLTAEEQDFITAELVNLENQGTIEAIKESGVNRAFHIFVLP